MRISSIQVVLEEFRALGDPERAHSMARYFKAKRYRLLFGPDGFVLKEQVE